MDRDCVTWDETAEDSSPSGVGKRVMRGSGASLVRVRVPAGTVAGRHSHAHEQFVQVIEGAGTLETERGTYPFGPGSVFHFTPDAWHAARFDSETVLIETNLEVPPSL